VRIRMPAAVLAFLALVTPPAHAALSDFAAYTYTDPQGYTLPYRLFTPLGYDASKKYPLVLMLHGSGESGTDNIAPASHVSSTRIVDRAKTPEYQSFVLVPQSNNGWNWTGQGSLSDTQTVITQLEQQYSIDTKREYITGLSLGGFGTWNFLSQAPTRFAAAVPVAGYGSALPVEKAKDVPIWAYASSADTTVPAHFTLDLVNKLRAAGGNPRYTEYPFDQHNDSFFNDVYSEPQLYQWMFSQRLGGVSTSVPEPSGFLIIATAGLILVPRRIRNCGVALMFCLALAPISRANLALYEPFDYPSGGQLDGADGAALSAGGQIAPNGKAWYAAGYNTQTTYNVGSGTQIVNENLAINGLQSPSGAAVFYGGAGYCARLDLGSNFNTSTVYASFAFRVADITALSSAGGMIAGFNNTPGGQSSLPTSIASTLWVRPTLDIADDPQNFNIGLSKTAATATLWDSQIFTASQSASALLAVTSYMFNSGSADDISRLYLNPSPSTFGGVAPTIGTILSTASGSDISSWVSTFLLRQNTAAAVPVGVVFDELRVGTTYADVTPLPEPTTGSELAVFAALLAWRLNGRSRLRPFLFGKR
jgi:predicted esterase